MLVKEVESEDCIVLRTFDDFEGDRVFCRGKGRVCIESAPYGACSSVEGHSDFASTLEIVTTTEVVNEEAGLHAGRRRSAIQQATYRNATDVHVDEVLEGLI